MATNPREGKKKKGKDYCEINSNPVDRNRHFREKPHILLKEHPAHSAKKGTGGEDFSQTPASVVSYEHQ